MKSISIKMQKHFVHTDDIQTSHSIHYIMNSHVGLVEEYIDYV